MRPLYEKPESISKHYARNGNWSAIGNMVAMTNWAQRRTTDLLVRVAGVGCCATAYLAVGALMHLRVGPTTPPGPVAYGLAALGFLCGSIGTFLVALGRHIFDKIEVSERWRHRPAPAGPQSQQFRIDADSAALGVEYFAREADGPPAPPAVPAAADLPLVWREFGSSAYRSADMRVAGRC